MFTEEEKKERAREVYRRWREKSKKHICEYRRKYYQEHREEIIEKCKKRVLTSEQKEQRNKYNRERQRKLYAENREAILEKKRKQRKPQSKEYHREYWRKNRERLLKNRMQDRRDHPEKYQAQLAVLNALNRGELERSSICGSCGREIRTESHHYLGYAREHYLDVHWLCKSCHRIKDAKGGYSNSK